MESRKKYRIWNSVQPGKLINGVPESFTFVFINISDHDVRIPQPSRCASNTNGTVYLVVELDPPPRPGAGGGCDGGFSGVPPMRDQAKNWKVLKPGESLKVSVDRSKLFPNQQAPGTYEFWAEYNPPKIPAEDQRFLTEEGNDFPRSHLVSSHLTFERKK